MLQSLDQYAAIDRWSRLPPGGELSREQAIMNDGARRIYAARIRAGARTRLTPWWPDSDVTLVGARAALAGSRPLLLLPPPPPPSSQDRLH
jgi:hypothetical protein